MNTATWCVRACIVTLPYGCQLLVVLLNSSAAGKNALRRRTSGSVRLIPASRSARRIEPKNQILSRLIGPPTPPSNCRMIAVVGVPVAPVEGLHAALGEQLFTLLVFQVFGWYAYAPDPLNVLPPLLVMTLMLRPTPIGADASTPPVFTCVSLTMSAPIATYVICAS